MLSVAQSPRSWPGSARHPGLVPHDQLCSPVGRSAATGGTRTGDDAHAVQSPYKDGCRTTRRRVRFVISSSLISPEGVVRFVICLFRSHQGISFRKKRPFFALAKPASETLRDLTARSSVPRCHSCAAARPVTVFARKADLASNAMRAAPWEVFEGQLAPSRESRRGYTLVRVHDAKRKLTF